jgi:glycosyltransferase involved in cell wall biosynthesis
VIDIFHNILWSKYKAEIFSCVNKQAIELNLGVKFIQIAETENSRLSLGPVDYSAHKYPFTLLYEKAYESIPRLFLYSNLVSLVFNSDSKVVVLPGYSKVEHWLMLVAAVISKKKIAVFCDSTVNDRKQTITKNILKRVFFSLCKVTFAYGQRSSEYIQRFGVSSNRIISPCQASATPRDKLTLHEVLDIRLKAGLARNFQKRFIYVGRLSPEKSIDLLLEAWREHISDNALSELRIIGSGPEYNHLTTLIQSLGLTSSVKLIGALSSEDLGLEYLNATALILPSQSEPWGLVVNEAFYYGCPAIVSSNCGCVPELIQGKTGKAFSTGVLSSLVKSINEWAAQEIDIKESSIACRTLIDEFSPQHAAKKIVTGLMFALTGKE